MSAVPSPPLARWWLASFLVAGLVAMHGLGTHGAHARDHSTGAAPGPATATLHDGHRTHLATPTPPIREAALAESSTPLPGVGLLGLCLALLALGAAWCARRRLHRPAWTVPRIGLPARTAGLAATTRGPGPPLRAALSVWRC